MTVNNATKVYGSVNPTLSGTISGFMNGENSSVVSGAPSLTTSATTGSGVGTYAINAGQGNLVAANYTFSFVAGALTVTPASLLITANSASMVYGADLPTLTAGYAGFVNSDTFANLTTQPTLSTTATSRSDVGNYTITASDAVDANFWH